MRSFASHATVHAWLHSPLTKRIIVPGPAGPEGPGGPGGPAGPGGPWSPFSPLEATFSSQAESAQGRRQQQNKEPAQLHAASLDIRRHQVMKLGEKGCAGATAWTFYRVGGNE